MSVALYEKRRAEMVALLGEDKVREMETKLMDDHLIYGARPETDGKELKGLLG